MRFRGYMGDVEAIIRTRSGWQGVSDPRRGGGGAGYSLPVKVDRSASLIFAPTGITTSRSAVSTATAAPASADDSAGRRAGSPADHLADDCAGHDTDTHLARFAGTDSAHLEGVLDVGDVGVGTDCPFTITLVARIAIVPSLSLLFLAGLSTSIVKVTSARRE